MSMVADEPKIAEVSFTGRKKLLEKVPQGTKRALESILGKADVRGEVEVTVTGVHEGESNGKGTRLTGHRSLEHGVCLSLQHGYRSKRVDVFVPTPPSLSTADLRNRVEQIIGMQQNGTSQTVSEPPKPVIPFQGHTNGLAASVERLQEKARAYQEAEERLPGLKAEAEQLREELDRVDRDILRLQAVVEDPEAKDAASKIARIHELIA